MIETPARVTRIDGVTAWVVSEAPSSCGACGGKGCGSSVFNHIWHPDTQEFHVDNPIGATPGEPVVVGLPEGSLLKASAMAYLLPLLFVFLGAGLAHLLAGHENGELGATIGSLTGLVLAGFWLKTRRPARSVEPVILRLGTTACADRH